MEVLRDIAMSLAKGVADIGPFQLVSDGSAIPVFAFKLRDDVSGYSVFDVSDKLREYGWQVPAYTMPDDATDVVVLRIVVREGFTRDLGEMLLDGLAKATTALQEDPPLKSATRAGFSH
jgi:glutamate decarboxylase